MVIAEIDIEKIIVQKLQHDIVGHYQRFDVLSLNLDRRPLKPIWDMDSREKRENLGKRDVEEIKTPLGGLREKVEGRE